MNRHGALLAWLAALVALLAAGPSRAEGASLDGRWTASPMTVKWVIGDWGTACGPRPGGGGEPGGSVLVSQSGAELVITGGGRTYSTSSCWEQYPGLQRTGHSAGARSWKTTCRTAPGDPRQTTLNTQITATDDSISFYEAGQYQFVIQGQNCTASVGRYRTYALVQRAEAGAAQAPAAAAADTAHPSASAHAPLPKPAAPPPKPETSGRCATTSAPARLEVRPARKLIRAGEEFTFRALVYDAAGCPVTARPTWAIEAGGDHAELSGPATVRIREGAPEGEVRLTASVGGRAAMVTIEIASSDRYDRLLQSGAFNAEGEVDEAATVAIASQSIGASAAVAENRAASRKWAFVALVGVAAALIGGLGVFMFARARRSAAARAAKDAARRERKRREHLLAFGSPFTERAAAPPPPAEPPPPVNEAERRTVCPVCGTQYGASSKFCGKDGATLLPLN